MYQDILILLLPVKRFCAGNSRHPSTQDWHDAGDDAVRACVKRNRVLAMRGDVTTTSELAIRKSWTLF
jgi:hypothetical protein